MGSLRNIMNVDDDHVDSHSIRRDRRPASMSSLDHDLSVPMARYHHIPVDLSRQTSPPHILHPAAPPLGYNSHPGARRRSNTSTDSMDSSYGQSQNHTAYYQGTAMRPIMPGTVSGDHPVKLTPITGRVSRAKKGVPVHTCDVCRPPKTFTRAEHLRRHQLSHQPPELSCTVSGCKKVFYRKDLLDRHLQRHGEHDGKLNRDSSRRRRSDSSPSRPYSSSPPAPSMQQASSPYSVGAAATPASSVGMVAGHWSSVNRSTPPGPALQSPHMRDTQSAYHMADMSVVDPVTAGVVATYGEARPAGLGVINPQVTDPFIPETTPSNMSWTDSSGIPSTSSGSAYSTPATASSGFQQPSARAPAAEWSGPMPSYTTSPSPVITDNGYPMSFGYAATPPQVYSSVYGDGMGTPFTGFEHSANLYSPQMLDTAVRSMSPPELMVGHSGETLVAAPAALPVDRMMYPRTCSREPIDALGLYTLMPAALSHGIRSMIPTYIEVYWDKVHSMYPIIHKPTFEDPANMPEEHMEILQCAMAAIATQFLEHEDHRANGHQLHTYAMEKAKLYANSGTPEWPLPIMQATLLCEYYARFRGRNKKAYMPSPRFEALYQMVIHAQTTYPPTMGSCDASQQWRIWVHMESKRRLLSACFLLDVHAMSFLEQPRAAVLGLDYSDPRTLPIPLSMATLQLWDAQTYQEWSSISQPAMPATVGATILETITAADIASIPAFDASLFLVAYVLQLPQRHSLTKINLLEDASSISMSHFRIIHLFPYSPIAMSHLALHYTPLHTLLSVSGDSWVFNKKVLQATDFMEHQKQLEKWRDSGSAAVAVAFASRALKLFLGLQRSKDGNTAAAASSFQQRAQQQQKQRKEISDFWGIYVCSLICWAFGHVGAAASRSKAPTRRAAVQWLLRAADMEPGRIQQMSEQERQAGSGAVGLARASLEKDCLGGRSILLADAVGVLKKLEEGDNYRRF
ncbi:hypothetical protein M440DRAFT_1182170 [Trichoderma longibrachiatum ATCC 18648]|uniref:C2H2-type domain-containing protein n=1 Tax=Trichoderma longibrachiatum ATCC 18648 TaxID=983965 RepID=A0A2T4C8Y1_TRILO|nr:hypothetical protein M440DRAFT_1182170 [Trichoderma longibrachiatum ATCC 18648]